jgi:outer membrane protein assembly factor BamB
MRSACPTHHGRSAYAGPSTSAVAWSVTLGRSRQQPVVDADGRIYIADDLGVLHAVEPTGSVAWTLPLVSMGPEPTTYTALTTPAIVASGHVIVGTADGKVHGVKFDGVIDWSYSAGSAITGDPVIAGGGNIVVGADNGTVRWISPMGGQLAVFGIPTGIDSAPALSDHESVFIGPVDNQVRRLGMSSGLTWTSGTGWGPDQAVAIHPANMVVTVGYHEQSVFGAKHTDLKALDPETGIALWWTQVGDATPRSPIIGPGGLIHVPVDTGHQFVTCALVTTNPEGEVLWSYELEEPCGGDAVVDADGVVYVTGAEGLVAAIGPDGLLLWSLVLPDSGSRTLALGAEGQLYVMTGQTPGALHAFWGGTNP